MVIWLTGLSGVGKSTLGRALVGALRLRGLVAVLVDGDALRLVIGDATVGHDPDSRRVNAFRVARAAQCLEKQGCLTVVATMSLFHEVHAWNRENFSNYLEIYLETSRSTLERRHPDGLYHRALAGSARNVVGHDLTPEVPLQPHLRLSNELERDSLEELIALVREGLDHHHPGWEDRQKLQQCPS